MRFLTSLVSVLACMAILGGHSLRAAEPAAPAKIRVLLTYGGHDFEQKPFFAMFDALPNVVYTKAAMPKAADLLKPGLEKDFDVIVMYDMAPRFTAEQQKSFVALLDGGIGLVSLHHNLGAHGDWPEFCNIMGGEYLHKAREIGGKNLRTVELGRRPGHEHRRGRQATPHRRRRDRFPDSRRGLRQPLHVAGREGAADHGPPEVRSAGGVDEGVWQEPGVLLHARPRRDGVEEPQLSPDSRQRHRLGGGKVNDHFPQWTLSAMSRFFTVTTLLIDVCLLAVAAYLVTVVRASFEKIFADFGVALPPITVAILSLPASISLPVLACIGVMLAVEEATVRSDGVRLGIHVAAGAGLLLFAIAFYMSLLIPLMALVRSLQ